MPLDDADNADWDVYVVAGPSGVGKSNISYPLARRLGVSVVEIDDLFHAVEAMTSPEEQPMIHYWRTHPDALMLSPENLLQRHLDVCEAMTAAVKAVIDNHLETTMPIVLDGDYILPSLVSTYQQRVKAVFLYESSEEQIVRNYLVREPEAGEQRQRARVSVLFGEWLRAECARTGLSTMPVRPWDTVLERTIEAAAKKA